MKRALVLSGGGSKGAYEAGFLLAAKELNQHFDIVTGTSIGALNGALVAMGDYEGLEYTWNILDMDHVFNNAPDLTDLRDDFMTTSLFNKEEGSNLSELKESIAQQTSLAQSFLRYYFKNKGADNTPFVEHCRGLMDEERLLSSPIDFGICTVQFPSMKACYKTKSEMERGHMLDYLLASSACFPVFPMTVINGNKYIDGGFSDNLPIDLALDMGADEIVVVDMHLIPVHPQYINRPSILYSCPPVDLGGFMDFNKDVLERNKRLGYLMAYKLFGNYEGNQYTFLPSNQTVFHDYYKQLLMMEKEMRGFFNSNSSELTSLLLEANHQMILNLKDYTYITLDFIGELMGFDDLKVYAFEEYKNMIRHAFEKYMEKDYFPQELSLTRVNLSFLQNHLNRESIVGFFLHQMKYKEAMDMKSYYTFCKKELMMASLIYLLIGGLTDEHGYTQVLWLDGQERKYVEEVGSMNIMFLINDTVVTAPLEGSVLPGVTRDSMLTILRDWGYKVEERHLSVDELMEAGRTGALKEAWGTGTAAVISPVGELCYKGEEVLINDFKTGELTQKLYDTLTGIQWGKLPDKFNWIHKVK